MVRSGAGWHQCWSYFKQIIKRGHLFFGIFGAGRTYCFVEIPVGFHQISDGLEQPFFRHGPGPFKSEQAFPSLLSKSEPETYLAQLVIHKPH